MDTVRFLPLRAWPAFLLLAVLAAPAPAAPRVALVIGNATYAHAPALANPLNDAADIGAVLERLDFSVTLVENAGHAALRKALLEFTLAASASEMAVVFYAGHGIEVDRRNFLVPVDARLASDEVVEFEAVPLELVLQAVERASGLRLVILDACRENPFAVQMQRAGATRSIGRGLARLEPSGDTLVAYAAKGGTMALDGAGRNSPYTEALLAHLEEPGLEVMFMVRKVRDAVLAATGGRQEPFWYGSLSSRRVYLAARPVTTEPEPSQGPSTADKAGSDRVAAERLATERVFWESVRGSEHPVDIQSYLDRYPGGNFEALALNRLKHLEDPAEPSASQATATPAAASTVVTSPKCTELSGRNLEKGHAECWQEIENRPGCHLWRTDYRSGQITTWSGRCREGVAEGHGVYSVSTGSERSAHEGTGTLAGGKANGRWVVKLSSGNRHEGEYRDGKQHGRGT